MGSNLVRVLVGLMLVAGCGSEADEAKFEIVRVPQETKDFNLPSALWDRLLIDDPESAEARRLKKESGGETLQSTTMVFSSLAVELVEKNQGVLVSPRLRFEFAKGGGTIDLAKYKGGRSGTFFVRFDFEGLKASHFNAYYLSQGRTRKVDHMTVGSGCRTFFNMTSSMQREIGGRGIPVNTTRDMHVSALAGHFFMSWLQDGVLNVTQVRFIDSSREDLICPPLRGGGA